MAHTHAELVRNTDFDPQTGTPVAIAPGVVRLTAPNASPYTFTGTNSLILGDARVLVVDPGPEDGQHLDALRALIASRPVDAVVLTHTHRDHSALAPALAREVSAPLVFSPSQHGSRSAPFLPDMPLGDGERLETDCIVLGAVATPGHSADHFGFTIEGSDLFLSGDHVMGWSTTLVAAPDGSLSDYFASLDRVIALVQARYLPAHGDAIADGRLQAQALKAHRERRNSQILDALTTGATTREALMHVLYPGIEAAVRPAARMTLEAHLTFLTEKGDIVVTGPEETSPVRRV